MTPSPLISVEAAVKSNRSNFSSVFEVDNGSAQHSLKDFFADPILMKQCVTKLKKNGFKVSQVGKISLSIRGPVPLFEEIFSVKIIQTENGLTCEGKDRFGYIDTKNSSYASWLAGIAFYPTTTFQNNDLTEEDRISVTKVPVKLGIKNTKAKLLGSRLKSRVNVAVIDSGLYLHSHILDESPNDLTNITVESVRDQNYIDRLIRDLRELSDFYRIAVRLYKTINSLAGYSVLTDVDDLPAILKSRFTNLSLLVFDVLPDILGRALKRVGNVSELVKLLETAKKRWALTLSQMEKIRDEDDPDNHGTKVVATLLEFVRDTNTQIRVIKTGYADPFNNFKSAFDQLLGSVQQQDRPHIVNCSFGTDIPGTSTQEPQSKLPIRQGSFAISPLYLFYRLAVKNIVSQGITVVFSAGNYSSKKPNCYVIEPQWPFVISVGGAYKTKTAAAFIYSNDSHGYESEIFPNRVVPDISGINGPQGFALTEFPKVPKGWEAKNGTSFAAPQVTGACVFIKKVFPSATPAQIKEILIRTGQPIGSGKSAQGVEMNTLRHRFPNGDEVAPGVLDIDLCVTTAKYAHVLTIKGRTPVDMSYAVRRAKQRLAKLAAGN